MSALGTHAVKVKFADSKAWWFVTPEGGTNRLRIYAATMDDAKAREVAKAIEQKHTGVQAKAVKL